MARSPRPHNGSWQGNRAGRSSHGPRQGNGFSVHARRGQAATGGGGRIAWNWWWCGGLGSARRSRWSLALRMGMGAREPVAWSAGGRGGARPVPRCRLPFPVVVVVARSWAARRRAAHAGIAASCPPLPSPARSRAARFFSSCWDRRGGHLERSLLSF